MIRLCASVALAVLLAWSAARPLDELEWLVGCWQYTSPRGAVITETWRRAAPDTMAGVSETRRGGSIVESEVMHIVRRGDAVVFIAEPSGQARTEFRASSATRAAAVFENPEHDFPQRVSYRPAPDSLIARIEGTVDGALRSVDFPMSRAQCVGH